MIQAETGESDALLELDALPKLPPAGAHLWTWFLELHATRPPQGMGSPARLTRQELRLWEADELGRPLTMWERRLVMGIDAEWHAISCEQQAKRNRKSEGGKKP